jgi:hypothetical protein
MIHNRISFNIYTKFNWPETVYATWEMIPFELFASYLQKIIEFKMPNWLNLVVIPCSHKLHLVILYQICCLRVKGNVESWRV